MTRCSSKILLQLCLSIAIVHGEFEVSQIAGEYALARGPPWCEVDMKIPAVRSSNINISISTSLPGDSITGTIFNCVSGSLKNVVHFSRPYENTLTSWFESGRAAIEVLLVGAVEHSMICRKRNGGYITHRKNINWNFVRPRTEVLLNFAEVLHNPSPNFAPLRDMNELVLKCDFKYLFVGQECAYEAITASAPISICTAPAATTEPSPEPTLTPEAACFPSSAQVSLRNGGSVRMSELRAGHHEIAVPTLRGYSHVFLFTHRDIHVSHTNFLRITTASRHSITITPDHYIYANGRLTTARSVRISDKLELISGKLSPVVAVETQYAERGLIAPHALHSTGLYVNGIRTSSYTRAVHPTLAHMLLAPIRYVVRLGVSKEPLGNLLYKGVSRLAKLIPSGPERL